MAEVPTFLACHFIVVFVARQSNSIKDYQGVCQILDSFNKQHVRLFKEVVKIELEDKIYS